jgi:hypothetical protein
MIIKSNKLIQAWGKLPGDVPSASAILDRFLHPAEIISTQGSSYGMQNRPADGATEADPKPASTLTGKARRLRGGDAAADRKTGADATT